MHNFVIREEAIHYAAAFLERWAEKAPGSKEYVQASTELRRLSNHLLENLYHPMEINVVRHFKKK